LSFVEVSNLEEDHQSLIAEELAEWNDLRNKHHVTNLALVEYVQSIEDFIGNFLFNFKVGFKGLNKRLFVNSSLVL
jgi:hypothetical protein